MEWNGYGCEEGGGYAIIIRRCLERSGAEQRLEVLAPSLVGLLCQQCGAVRNAILLPPSSDGRATPFACLFACSFERNVKLNK